MRRISLMAALVVAAARLHAQFLSSSRYLDRLPYGEGTHRDAWLTYGASPGRLTARIARLRPRPRDP